MEGMGTNVHLGIACFVIVFMKSVLGDCDATGVCTWNKLEGFKSYAQDDVPIKICGTHCDVLNATQDGYVLAGATVSVNGTLNSDVITSTDTSPKQLTLGAYLSTDAKSKGTAYLRISIVQGTIHTQILGINLTEKNRWEAVTAAYTAPRESYILTIDVTLQKGANFLAVTNVSVVDTASTDNNEFQCDANTSVPWSQVCNMQEDCPNGKDETICNELHDYAVCTFEDGLCGWHNMKSNDHFDWRRSQGPSPTPRTGPYVDHTLGTNKGYYMYIEGSDGAMLQFATLQSDVLPKIPQQFKQQCKLRFFYHMVGRQIGNLEVKVGDLCVSNADRLPRLVWSKRGSQRNRWHYAEVPIVNVTSKYFIQIKAYGAVINHGDIAVDDISFSPECFGISHNTTNYVDTAQRQHAITFDVFKTDLKTHCELPPVITKSANVSKEQVLQESSTPTKPVSERRESSAEPVHKASEQPPLSWEYVVAILLSATIVIVVVAIGIFYIALRHRKDGTAAGARLEMVSTVSEDNCTSAPVQASSIDMQLRCAVTELNPNYDFITAKYPEQQLREIPRNKLKLIRLLGQGAFGEVYEGSLKNMCVNVKELAVAVKTLPALSSEQAETDFLMEAVIISKFMHKNVVKCLGVCFEEHPRYIILELLEGGDLKIFLRDSRPRGEQRCILSMEDLVKLSLDVANGCHHLEEKHFVHRDIAARNCILTTRGPGRIAKIADFGMSRDIYSADYYRKGGKTMLPIKWMPPEAFLDGVFTSKTDVWSFGVLLWEIFTLGYMPYPGQTNTDVMHFVSAGGRLDPPENSPARLNKIMILCWNSIADIRPSFSEIIELLDMCLQDDEVLTADVSACHLPMPECFKDASTLAKTIAITETTANDQNDNASADEPLLNNGNFKIQLESESREPLLLSSPDC